jgi:hypothetical protein
MKEKFNMKSIIAGLVCIIVGGLGIGAEFVWETDKGLWFNLGCSLLSSGLVILLTALFVERMKVNPLDDWKIVKITATRAEINAECEIELGKVKKQVDIVAFGLQSFRSRHSDKKILEFLKRGVNFRILTMDPESKFIEARETEEDDTNIRNSINKLIEWADEINQKSSKGKIIIKGYSSMTLDFYWRCDNTLYVGPYWYKCGSQQTITYKYINGGTGFKTYTDYFEDLWENEGLARILTKATSTSKDQ